MNPDADATAPSHLHSLPPKHRVAFSFMPHLAPLLILCGLSLVYWSKVLCTGQVLLPGHFLRGFAPFGADPQAPWNILQWDGLGQYYPWRTLAARQLHDGLVPLWNPHQFAGAPFLANAQSAVLYPLSLPFWVMDTAYAFGVSALLHTLLAAVGTYCLTQHWQLSRAASLLAAISFAFCGYLAAWVMLPTLANTASWLPLALLLFERAAAPSMPRRNGAMALLSLVLCGALLAGHPQIFVYIVMALGLRACLLPRPLHSIGTLAASCVLTVFLGAAQILPTLELARLGHRAAAGGATAESWSGVAARALHPGELLGLLLPFQPMAWGSLNENFGYIGLGVVLLAAIGMVSLLVHFKSKTPGIASPRPWAFASILTCFGLLYALATPVARLLYFTVPGLAQMGGVGRALLLWSLGVALLAAFGLDAMRRRWSTPVLPAIALGMITIELFAAGWSLHPIAPRPTVYPQTQLTTWLREHTRDGSRVLFLTPRGSWLPQEALAAGGRRTHPAGVLPPNGAAVYGLFDVNGYDSLAPRAYRNFVLQGEADDVAPPLNGNMILLNNPNSPALDALGVRYIVSQQPIEIRGGRGVLQADGCYVYDISGRNNKAPQRNGSDFYPGWHNARYQPTAFRFGLFLALCALGFTGSLWFGSPRKPR